MAVIQDEAATILSLSGRLTFAENAEFRQMVDGLDQSDAAQVVLDLTALEFLDATGMGMLLVVRDNLAARGGRMTLRNAQGQVGRMLELAKFSDFFTLEF